MQPRLVLVALALAASAPWAPACGSGGADELPPELYTSSPTYARDVRPILEAYCVECHASEGIAGKNIRLDTYAGASKAGDALESVCTAITAEVKAKFPAELFASSGSTSGRRGRGCSHPYSMPPGAMTRLSAREQVIYVRWLQLGSPEK